MGTNRFCQLFAETDSNSSKDGFGVRSSDCAFKTLCLSRTTRKSASPTNFDGEIPESSLVCDLILWKKPLHSIIVLLMSTVVYMYSVAINQTLISSISNLLLYIITTFCVVTNLSDFLKIKILSNPLPVEIPPEVVTCVVASLANLIGAAEGVLRVAAFGSDFKLFAKVVSFLFFTSVLGKLLSGKAIVFLGVLFLFTVPVTLSKFLPEKSTSPKVCSKRFEKKTRKSNSFRHVIETSDSVSPSFRSPIQFDS